MGINSMDFESIKHYTRKLEPVKIFVTNRKLEMKCLTELFISLLDTYCVIATEKHKSPYAILILIHLFSGTSFFYMRKLFMFALHFQ